MNSEDVLKKKIKEINLSLGKINHERKKLVVEKKEILKILESLEEPLMVVPSIELKDIVQMWIDSGRTLVALAEEAAVSHKTLKDILQGKRKFTNEIIADSIRTTVGVPHLDLTFMPNPTKAPQSQYWEE